MKITIHRGTDQIGGCVTEYYDKGWRLFVDYGEQLPGAHKSDTPLIIEGLNHGDISKSALLITHYHGDHIGKIAELPAELPIYMGKIAREIALKSATHRSAVSENLKRLDQRLETIETFTPGEQFSFGTFNIMPIVMDHSAFDAYAFIIESRQLKVFHTGDFRTHGFRSSKLPQVIDKYVGKRVDYVVCEATNVKRPDAKSRSEFDLHWEFQNIFKENKYNVVYLSSTNIDRLFGLYHAALKAHRPFYVDSFQKEMMDIVAGRDPIWGKSDRYRYKKDLEPIPLHIDENKNEFRVNDKFIDKLEELGYVIVARSGDKFDNLLSKIPSEGRRTFLSMWQGYVDETLSAYNPSLAKSLANGFEYKHTSGHCDMESLEGLLTRLNPYAVIPIHTDDPHAFADIFSDRFPVILLEDGESFSAIKDPGYDNIEAHVYAYKKPEDDLEVIDNPENLQVFSLNDKCLGEFQTTEDAMFALRHVVYAPLHLLAYGIEEVEDMEYGIVKVYNPDLSIHSTFGSSTKEILTFNPGDKVLCMINDYRCDAVIPAVIVEPFSEKLARKWFDEAKDFGLDKDESFEEWMENLPDWSRDVVVVRPLVKLKLQTELEEMGDTFEVQRVFIFPYRELE